MKSFKKDYETGMQGEVDILPIINQYFQRNIIKKLNKFCKYDFEDDEYKYELKTRNNNYDTYDTTLIGCDKVMNCNLIFLFKFYDGLYYIPFDEDKFKLFEKKQFVRNARSDYYDIKKDYLFIPINQLIKI